ncbi:MAG: YigZ family protein [Oscillospiraceae bacterium]
MSYNTIKGFSSDEFIINKSRFIVSISHVGNIAQANDFVGKISKQHFDATHNVFAYRIRNENIDRYSDDGEPQGTAGLPLLSVLVKENLTDVCVVATRYFGGILLGGGGLVRAYSHCGKIAVDSAQIEHMIESVDFSITCEYPLYGKINFILPDFDVKVIETVFSETVKITLRIKYDFFKKFQKALIELSGNSVSIDTISQGFDSF